VPSGFEGQWIFLLNPSDSLLLASYLSEIRDDFLDFQSLREFSHPLSLYRVILCEYRRSSSSCKFDRSDMRSFGCRTFLLSRRETCLQAVYCEFIHLVIPPFFTRLPPALDRPRWRLSLPGLLSGYSFCNRQHPVPGQPLYPPNSFLFFSKRSPYL